MDGGSYNIFQEFCLYLYSHLFFFNLNRVPANYLLVFYRILRCRKSERGVSTFFEDVDWYLEGAVSPVDVSVLELFAGSEQHLFALWLQLPECCPVLIFVPLVLV